MAQMIFEEIHAHAAALDEEIDKGAPAVARRGRHEG